MNEITLVNPLDMHVHFRQDDMLRVVAPLTAATFSGAMIMPNLIPQVDNLEYLKRYREDILLATADFDFQPYMTLFFRDYTETELEMARPFVTGIKLYPVGSTTNSENGVRDIRSMGSVLKAMEDLDIALLVHGETHGFVMDREEEFHGVYRYLAETYPRLRITMEHITTAGAVRLLDEYENLRATITLHHLLITLDDVVGGLMNPHLFCKPIAKRPEDRDVLLQAAVTAHPRVMFGSDSAPHPVNRKECPGCAAGIFTSPIALALLTELFDSHQALNKLQAFVSDNAAALYHLQPPQRQITLVRTPWRIPDFYGETIVPMWSGRETAWSVKPA